MKYPLLYLTAFVFVVACSPVIDKEEVKSTIVQMEKDFASMAAEKGLAEAFHHFAAEDAVLMRGNKLVEGKEAIHQFYQERNDPTVKLEWAPTFVEVANSGELAYTYGDFSFSRTDTTGEVISSSGIFHTVWKKQADGSWKYVWD